MSDDKIAMPGDADESVEKLRALKEESKAARGRRRKDEDAPEVSKAEAVEHADKVDEAKRGPFAVAQTDDDGWNELPVQARAENQLDSDSDADKSGQQK